MIDDSGNWKCSCGGDLWPVFTQPKVVDSNPYSGRNIIVLGCSRCDVDSEIISSEFFDYCALSKSAFIFKFPKLGGAVVET